MSKLTKLETLQKKVADTDAAHDAAYKAWEDAWDTYADVAYVEDVAYVAYDDYFKAKRELARCLREQDK
tara:strand:+ start:1000 stop:1206 length:207 start_codon:yes stop_codon:yes gene_type:complete